jgi:hypothetical protein
VLIDSERKPWQHLTLQGSYFIPITMKVLEGLFFNSRAVTCDKVLYGFCKVSEVAWHFVVDQLCCHQR